VQLASRVGGGEEGWDICRHSMSFSCNLVWL